MAPKLAGSRLRRSDPRSPGYGRVRRGRGFSYRDPHGTIVRDEELKERFVSLAIPPAWTDVWIAPWPNGHIQATGIDAAGRCQYLYHPRWRQRRDRVKFDRALDLASSLPAARAQVTRELRQSADVRQRMLAGAFRMLDAGSLRIGSERCAEENGSHGLSTLLRSHVSTHGSTVMLSFPAKSGQFWQSEIDDEDLATFIQGILRQGEGGTLLSWTEDGTEFALSAEEINAFVRLRTGGEFTAKDFRTLRGTMTAATSLADIGPVEGVRKQSSAIARAIEDAANVLGNTPAIARSSYVDPRLLDRYRAGETIDSHGAKPTEGSLRRLLLGNDSAS